MRKLTNITENKVITNQPQSSSCICTIPGSLCMWDYRFLFYEYQNAQATNSVIGGGPF